jgi:hypothetical protein
MNNLHLYFAFHLSSFFLDIFGQLSDAIFFICRCHSFASSVSMEVEAMEVHDREEIHNCLIKLVNLLFPTFCCLFNCCFHCREVIPKGEGIRFTLAVEQDLAVTGLWLLLSCCKESKN